MFLAGNHETPLPAILTVNEDRKEGPLSYHMSGDYIVVSPVPQNMVLRYGNRIALLWTTRRVTPSPAPATVQPSQIAQRMAAAPANQSVAQPAPVQPSPAPQNGAVRVANVTALYTDKLTDGRE